MKYLMILILLVLNCSRNNSSSLEKTTTQIYDECYKISDNMFKKIPSPEYRTLTVDQLCNEDTSFYEGVMDEVCEKACKYVFNFYKTKAK